MKHYFETVANQSNVLVPNARVDVYLTGTLTHAPLFSDNGITAKGNPLFTDSLGRFDFYVADGVYDITVSGGSISTVTQSAIEIADVTETTTTDENWQTQELQFANQTAGTQPPSGFSAVYSKTPSKHLFFMDDTGLETDLFAGVSSNLLVTDNIWTGTNAFANQVNFQGPNPWSDVTLYGARPSSPNIPPYRPGITASCSSGSSTIHINGGNGFEFVTGDGITLWGCGSANGLSTPSAPTITPSISSGPTSTGMVVNAPAGTTNYQYQIVAVNKGGGFTPAGAIGTTTAGNALGFQSVSLTSCAKSNNTVTCITAAPHGLATGAMVIIENTTRNNSFGGWSIVASVPDNTHFTYTTQGDTRIGSAPLCTGGTVGWFNENHITWTPVTGALYYLIYGNTAGSMQLIGLSKFQNPGVFGPIDASFDDFGQPMMGTPVFLPGQFPSSPPVTGQNNSLTTTIIAGGGTDTVVAATTASNTLSNATMLLDAAPGIVAAIAATGQAFIPQSTDFVTGLVVNSYAVLNTGFGNNFSGIFQQGGLQINGTLELSLNTQWYGNVFPTRLSVPSFANGGYAGVFIGTSVPGVFLQGVDGASNTLNWKGLQFTGQPNAIQVVIDWPSGIVAENLSFGTTGGADYTSMPLLVRLSGFEQSWRNVSFVTAQGIRSTTPLFFCNSCATTRMELVNLSGRGIFYNGVSINIDYGRKQGLGGPVLCLASLSGANVVGGASGEVGGVPFTYDNYISNYELDTDSNPLVVNVQPAFNNGVGLRGLTIVGGLPFPSLGGAGGAAPVISGQPFAGVQALSNFGNLDANNSIFENVRGGIGSNGNGHPTWGSSQTSGLLSQSVFNQNVTIGGQNGIAVAFNAPLVTATVSTSCSGTFPVAGNYFYNVTVVGADGVESLPGPQSNTIALDGLTQCAQLNWTDVLGATGYKVYANTQQLVFGGCVSFGVLVAANNCIDNRGSASGGYPNLNGTGSVSAYPGLLSTPKLVFSSGTLGSYGKSTRTGNFTANRTVTLADSSGSEMLFGTSTGSLDVAQATGADICAKIAATWQALAASPFAGGGGIADARGFHGLQACASSMFASYPSNFSGKLLLAPDVQIATNVTQILPTTGVIINGNSGHPTSTPNPNMGATIRASNTFPGSSPVIQMGSSVAFGNKLFNLRISCVPPNGTVPANCICVQNQWTQEGAELGNVWLAGGSDTCLDVSTSQAQNSSYHDLSFSMDNVNNANATCARFGSAAGSALRAAIPVRHFTCNGNNNAATQLVGMAVDASNVQFSDYHIEQVVTGFEVGANKSTHGVVLLNGNCSSTAGKPMTTCIDVSASNNTDLFSVIGNQTANATNVTNALVDNQTNGGTITATGEGGVGAYLRGVNNIVLTNSTSLLSRFASGFGVTNLLLSGTAPTISSGFGTSPSVPKSNGTAAFTINVGTGGVASSGVVALPTATNGWNCTAVDITNPTTGGGFFVKQTAGTVNSITLTGYNTAGAVTAWTSGDILQVNCSAF